MDISLKLPVTLNMSLIYHTTLKYFEIKLLVCKAKYFAIYAVLPANSDSDVMFCLQLLSKILH